MGASERRSVWPDLSGPSVQPTLATLHLRSQVVGKIRLMLTPWENHGWHVPLYLTPGGFATGLIPVAGAAFTIDFDLLGSQVLARSSVGRTEHVPLADQSMAAFSSQVLLAVRALGVAVEIDPMPTEIPDAVRFDRDEAARAFDPEAAVSYWRALLEVQRTFQLFRTRFVGKVSPIHLFWGAFDLAVTRFSGRTAPRHPGGAPFLNDAVAREAYSREVSSAGFWPNLDGPDGPAFYSYAYPAPDGFAGVPVRPDAARFDKALGEFVLPYAAVRAADDPDAALMSFLETTYAAAADLAGWDRQGLECAQGALGTPPDGS